MIILEVFHYSRDMSITRGFVICADSGFGGLEVTCWPLVPKFEGSHPAEAVGFLGQKKSLLRRGSKAVGPLP
jgi:hypothetical protein